MTDPHHQPISDMIPNAMAANSNLHCLRRNIAAITDHEDTTTAATLLNRLQIATIACHNQLAETIHRLYSNHQNDRHPEKSHLEQEALKLLTKLRTVLQLDATSHARIYHALKTILNVHLNDD